MHYCCIHESRTASKSLNACFFKLNQPFHMYDVRLVLQNPLGHCKRLKRNTVGKWKEANKQELVLVWAWCTMPRKIKNKQTHRRELSSSAVPRLEYGQVSTNFINIYKNRFELATLQAIVEQKTRQCIRFRLLKFKMWKIKETMKHKRTITWKLILLQDNIKKRQRGVWEEVCWLRMKDSIIRFTVFTCVSLVT